MPPREPGFHHYRWVMCALIFFATTVNYVDRQVIGILGPTLSDLFHWDKVQYSQIVISFQAAYAIGLLLAGRFIDRVGTKVGYSLALIVWSLAAMGHAWAASLRGFIIARFVLGLGEAGNFPAAIKTVAEWFPARERALATGIFNSGTNIGAILAPWIVPILTIRFGWQWAFIVTGAIGFLWLLFWIPLYSRPETHPRITRTERELVMAGRCETSEPVSWLKLLGLRQTWAFIVGKFFPDSVWWFYLYWAPTFLKDRFEVDLKTLCLPMVTIYLVADVGSIAGGWMSSTLIKRGWTANLARKLTMLTCVLLIMPVVFAPLSESKWTAVILIGIAAAAHQGWSANIFTVVADMFPQKMVGSVVGIGGMAGAVGGIVLTFCVGQILKLTNNNYVPIFIIAAGIYALALAIIHILVPRLQPARFEPHNL